MEIALGNIQGNVFGGFNKDFQDFVFLKFTSRNAGRAWIKEISDDGNGYGVAVSSSKAVLQFNAQFKALKAEGKKPELFLEVSWTNLSISCKGLVALGVTDADVLSFSDAFREGMAARDTLIGDVGTSAPSEWLPPFKDNDVHAVLAVAADSVAMLKWRLGNIRAGSLFSAGVIELGTVAGRTRQDLPNVKPSQVGHEHFGFKDGVSQPGIRGIDLPDDPVGNPDQGHPGQDLLWPGEFVLGYPTQIPHAEDPEHDGPNRNPGHPFATAPAWATDGSYLVFRRLAQHVPEFHQHIDALTAAAGHGMTTELMGAKLVGRYASGCPVEARKFQPMSSIPYQPSPFDPESVRAGQADDDTLNNNFEFGNDPIGTVCPLPAHIRKAYPRDEITLPVAKDSESETQTHRLLRRGIPFGGSVGAAEGGGPNDPRGLVFQCYQKSIEGQFEFVQRSWVNTATFPPGSPSGTPGEDPIIAQSDRGPFDIEAGKQITVQHFVQTTGGEYFFSPSIAALQQLGAGTI